MNTVNVDLDDKSYSIFIEDDLLKHAGRHISEVKTSDSLTIITNETVASLYLNALKTSLEKSAFRVDTIIIPDGERYKTLAQVEDIYHQLVSYRLDRQSMLVALGGGVVGDITGFAAASFLRGVPFIQIPTSLLAQVDSSVGGKTGVNLAEGKNLIGAFYQPSLVLIDPTVLRTLPEKEFLSGMSEVIKYGVISDADFFSFLESSMTNALALESEALSHIIKKCCGIKADVTSRDETEKGLRAILNFGHTIGHAIETLTGYTGYTHGEAVAIGMAAAVRLSHHWGLCNEADIERITALLKAARLPYKLPPFSATEYLEVMLKDKKKIGQAVKMVLVTHIGEVTLQITDRTKLLEGLQHLLSAQ